jgi:hypothetical protein
MLTTTTAALSSWTTIAGAATVTTLRVRLIK